MLYLLTILALILPHPPSLLRPVSKGYQDVGARCDCPTLVPDRVPLDTGIEVGR